MILRCLFLLAAAALEAHASALTVPIAANERQCFYADVDKVGEKIGVCMQRSYVGCPLLTSFPQFYFAVRISYVPLCFPDG